MISVSKEFKERLLKSTGAYIFVHTRPDYDCVCSAVAMSVALNRLGKRSVIMAENVSKIKSFFNKTYSVISNGCDRFDIVDIGDNITDLSLKSDRILVSDKIMDYDFLGDDPVILFCDCNPERTGKFVDEYLCSPISDCYADDNILIVDHHPAEGEENALRLIDENMSSASEMCAYVIRDVLGAELDVFLSQFLFMGIASDSGFFKYSNKMNSADTFLLSSQLIKNGAIPDVSYAIMHYGRGRDYNLYLSGLLRNVKYFQKSRIALVVDSRDMFFRYGHKRNRPSGELFDILINTEGVDAVVFVKYGDEKGEVSCSVRVGALSDFDAGEFCRRFGNGGGHKKAAAFKMKGEFCDVVGMVHEQIDYEEKSYSLRKCA